MLVSICIPCYNTAKYLTETLTALINQRYKEIEIIIIDDHSTDNSIEIIKQFAKKDGRIKFETAKRKGAAGARNQAYLLSNGEYIIFFDGDDWIPPNFIETQLNRLKSNKEVVVAKWGRFYGDDLGTISIAPHQMQNDLTFENWVISYWHTVSHMTCPGRVVIPRNLIEQSSLWDEDLSLNDDFTFYTRIFSNSDLIRFNDDSIFHYRSGIDGLSSKKGNLAFQSLYKSITRSISIAKSKLKESKQLNNCYANVLQNFIYETYPFEDKLIEQAEQSIKTLGGANFQHPAGGKTKLANHFLGWKLVQKIKLMFLHP